MAEEFWIKDAESIRAKLTFTMDKSVDMRNSGGKGYHAQFAWFIYIADRNPQSAGYGNFLWFGLNIFSSTQDFAGDYAAQDTAGGPGNFIYSLGAKKCVDPDNKIIVGQKVVMDCDIIPHLEDALDTAHTRGFMTGSCIPKYVEICQAVVTSSGCDTVFI